MLNAVKSEQLAHSLRRSAYPHQPYVDTLYVLPPRRRRPKLALTAGSSIPLYNEYYYLSHYLLTFGDSFIILANRLTGVYQT